jgi:hypothetical protein
LIDHLLEAGPPSSNLEASQNSARSGPRHVCPICWQQRQCASHWQCVHVRVLPEKAKEIRKRGGTKVRVILPPVQPSPCGLPTYPSVNLRMHMTKKPYKCAFCKNRFKNKNEAERHQNSLHLRRHSWSCAAISGYEAAFHPSTLPASQTPNGPSADACGDLSTLLKRRKQAGREQVHSTANVRVNELCYLNLERISEGKCQCSMYQRSPCAKAKG